MSNTPIKKSFLFKLSPPFNRRLAPPNLLNVPMCIIISNCSLINGVMKNNALFIYLRLLEFDVLVN